MDRAALKQRLMARCEATVEAAMAAVDAAPDGAWISGSEWPMREVFQKLTAECFQEIVQARIDDHATANAAAFSPERRRPRAAPQRKPRGARADGRR